MNSLNKGFFDSTGITGEQIRPKLIGIVGEIAPTSDAKTDAELGIGEFHSKYFGDFPLYYDKDKRFFELLGSRTVLSQKVSSWNPFRLWQIFKDMLSRAKNKGITGNEVGSNEFLGGLFILYKKGQERGSIESLGLAEAPDTQIKCFYAYPESTGDEIPVDGIQYAIYHNSDF